MGKDNSCAMNTSCKKTGSSKAVKMVKPEEPELEPEDQEVEDTEEVCEDHDEEEEDEEEDEDYVAEMEFDEDYNEDLSAIASALVSEEGETIADIMASIRDQLHNLVKIGKLMAKQR